MENALKTLHTGLTKTFVSKEELVDLKNTVDSIVDKLEFILQTQAKLDKYISDEKDTLHNDVEELKNEFKNYQKVSIIKNLNDQLHERDLEIHHLSNHKNSLLESLFYKGPSHSSKYTLMN